MPATTTSSAPRRLFSHRTNDRTPKCSFLLARPFLFLLRTALVFSISQTIRCNVGAVERRRKLLLTNERYGLFHFVVMADEVSSEQNNYDDGKRNKRMTDVEQTVSSPIRLSIYPSVQINRRWKIRHFFFSARCSWLQMTLSPTNSSSSRPITTTQRSTRWRQQDVCIWQWFQLKHRGTN